MNPDVTGLVSVLDLEQLEVNLFRGYSPQNNWKRVFGGQVVGQAMVAAARTVEDRLAHSLHCYFLLGGDPKVPIIFEVDRIRDGSSFTTRNVVAIQHGAAIFSMSVSFHKQETGFSHQIRMPVVPGPDELPTEEEMKNAVPPNMRGFWELQRPIELRPVSLDRYLSPETADPEQRIWFRTKGALPDDKKLHQCALAYASDFTLLSAGLVPHARRPFDPALMMASLDHAVWFHRDFRADEWLLYVQDSPSAEGARVFCRGSIFSRDGVLVASVAQEGLVRVRRDQG
ncbi:MULTISPECIES: acyl-CoA thioesterase II [Rhodomicrobium]|uniref:acyl-CoA thioesterase II n=1 Tax=Rhodomicrobium TaxID=1068 RepID=UPI000B4A6650|nr:MULTISPECIES: acyl-CoA thioesterase II [Rhodomicrobium]